MPNKKKTAKKISSEKYRDIIEGLDLEDLRITEGKFSLKIEELAPESNLRISGESTFEKDSNGTVLVYDTYRLSLINKKSRKKSLGIECTFCLNYSSKKEFTKQFFETFKEHNLPLNTWPFFREYVFNITSKMNIPPLTLPLLKRFYKEI